MTKANSNLHRAVALLAALCLLASMALPVYAAETETEFSVSNSETIPDDDNTGNGADGTGSDISVSNVETIQKDADTTNEGSKTEPEISVPESGTITSGADTTDKAAGAPPADGVTGSENTTPADNAAADKTADADKTNLTEENTSDDEEGTADGGEDPVGEAGAKETFFAADTYSEDETESDDRSAPMTASNEGEAASFVPNTVTISFAVDSSYQDGYYVHLYADRGNDNALHKDMVDTGKVTTDGDRKIFSVSLSKADYPEGGFYRLIFQYFTKPNGESGGFVKNFFAFGGEGSDGDGFKKWTSIDKIAGQMYDGTNSNQGKAFDKNQWTRVEYYYAGMPLYFKNASDTPLDGVTATFYKKDESGTFVETGSQTIGTVAANTVGDQKITIPNNQSQFVKFTWKGCESEKYYNFSKDSYGATEYFDLTANNCFVYSGSTESPWQDAGSDLLTKDKPIYFDATLSSYGYDGEGLQQSPMPHKDDKMYCFFVKNDGTHEAVTMEKEKNTATNRQLWSCAVPDGGPFTAVQFSARQDADGNSAVDDLTKKYSTAEIPLNLKEPCFFADDGDPSAYTSGSGVYRDGYWGEKGAIRDAESGKDTTVVDIASDTFTQEAGTKYITSTLYDYYTDYELNGFNRDSYEAIGTHSQRWYVTFEQFDRALSSAYAANGNVQYPIYTGHFQASHFPDGMHFEDVAGGMDLYGWGNPNDENGKYNTFMAVNNSVLDKDGADANDEAGFARTFQGLVENQTSTGDANGLPVLKGTTNLVDPHFNKEFLEGKNTFNTVLGKVYENVSFPFTKGAVFKNTGDTSDKETKAEYWYYDSSESSLYLKQNKANSKYYLKSTKDSSGNLTADIKSVNRSAGNAEKKTTDASGNQISTYGFFPFNESVGTGGASQYNYGFGAKLQFDFTLTNDGNVQVGDNANDKVPIKFFFSGDDDVWVYIDGQLVLDVGGAHGKASGLLEFGSNGTDNTVTPYVSSNKAGGEVYTGDADGKSVYFNGNEVKFEKKGKILVEDGKGKGGEKEFTLDKGTTHTLTMFYMERGMWESNMAVAFNFPDHNELQVEKQVDLRSVDKDFRDCFKNQKIFDFTIQNLATHYGAKEAVRPGTGGVVNKVLDLTAEADVESIHPATTGSTDYIFALAPDPAQGSETNTGQVLHWFAPYNDLSSTSRDKRYGILKLNKPIDLNQYGYLTFEIYVKGETTLSLNNLYLQLLDDGNRQMGSLNKAGLNGATFGSVTLKPNQWNTVKLSLNKMNAVDGFDNQVKTIRVGDNYQRDIYFRNFTFVPKTVPDIKTGFTTEQDKIPDYGSATTGALENAKYAKYTSNFDGMQVVDDQGRFVLENGEIITFNDQFRRGSYISLKEILDTKLYGTTWTVYENGLPVTSMKGDEDVQTVTVKDPNKSLENQTAIVDQPGPDDGRTEKQETKQIDNNYSGTKPTDANTIVFRSYSNPDESGDSLTSLKVQYINKVKTGGLIIKKAAAENENLTGTYTFKVTFSDVGGQGLETGDPIVKTYPINMSDTENPDHTVPITGIPVGTRYTIEEVGTSDGSHLQGITLTGNEKNAHVVNNTTVEGVIVENDAGSTAPKMTATFTNTKRTLIDIAFTKLWQDADGKALTSAKLPTEICIQLQRRLATSTDDTDWEAVRYPDPGSANYVIVTPTPIGWQYPFKGLDQHPLDDNTNYVYRIVEGTVGTNDTFIAANSSITIGSNTYTISAAANLTGTTSSAANETITGGSGEIVLTNTLQDPKFTLNIVKKGVTTGENGTETQTPLSGVEFKLERLTVPSGGGEPQVDTTYNFGSGNIGSITGTTGNDGKIANNPFTNLKAGSYQLTEVKTAEGYNLLSKPIRIKFTTNGDCLIDGVKDTTNVTSSGNTCTMTLTVLNRKSFELPHTGADAPSLWLLIGLPALVAVLLVLVFRYNKKGGRR